jgi:hypothetical protein
VAWGGTGCTTGGGCQAGAPMGLSHPGLGLGPRQGQWAILFDGVPALSGGPARGLY